MVLTKDKISGSLAASNMALMLNLMAWCTI